MTLITSSQLTMQSYVSACACVRPKIAYFFGDFRSALRFKARLKAPGSSSLPTMKDAILSAGAVVVRETGSLIVADVSSANASNTTIVNRRSPSDLYRPPSARAHVATYGKNLKAFCQPRLPRMHLVEH